MNKEIKETVDLLNDRLYECIDDPYSVHSFWLESNSYIDAIKFNEVILWDSENDGREYSGIAGKYSSLYKHVKQEFDKYVEELNKIKL